MSLVFAGITPHPPILIPAIGKNNLDQLEKTKLALEQLAGELYAAQPDILIIISPHGNINPNAFTVNLAEKFTISFESFGDLSTKITLFGDSHLITSNKKKLRSKFNLNIIAEEKLDHGSGVPLYYLTSHLKEVKIVPIYFSMLDYQSHLEFGKSLKEAILETNERVAVIASGDMSHCLTKSAPAGFNPAGKEFDEKVIALIKNRDLQGIVNIDHELVDNAAECGLRSFLILFGVLNSINFNPEILSYEAPFGVGYLVANFRLE